MGLAFAVDREFACAERKSLPSEMRLLLRTFGFDSRNSVFSVQGAGRCGKFLFYWMFGRRNRQTAAMGDFFWFFDIFPKYIVDD